MQKRAKSSKKVPTIEAPAHTSAAIEVPAWLARSSLYKRVPAAVRAELDDAILLRPTNCATLEEIAEQFQLTERYKVSLPMLRTYARKLEELARPVMASQLIAGLLGCLPEGYRQRLVAGSQVLLLSRVVQALTAEDDSGLSVADLAKLASILSALAGQSVLSEKKRGRSRSKASGEHERDSDGDRPAAPANPTKLAEAVRAIYGISWPPTPDAATPPEEV